MLESAITVFATQGYGGASVAELAAAAGCSKNQLFHYFGSKEDLGIAAVRTALDSWTGRIAAPSAVFAGPLVRLDRIVELVHQHEARGWAALRLLALLALTSGSLPLRLREEAGAALEQVNEFIDNLARLACARHTGRGIKPGVLSAAVRGLLLEAYFVPQPQDRRQPDALKSLLGS